MAHYSIMAWSFFAAMTCLPWTILSFNTSFTSSQTRDVILDYANLLALHERFWDAFIFPASTTQLLSVNSSLFSDDVVGRVDESSTYIGRELNTEYIFGSFSDTSFNPAVRTLLGAPLSHQTIRFATNGNVVSASELVLFNSSLYDDIIPIKIDIWMSFNSYGEVTQYDTTFRWFRWLFNDVINSVRM